MAKTRSQSKAKTKAKTNATKPPARTARSNELAMKGSSVRLVVITDGTGGLPRHLLTVVLSQFPSWNDAPKFHIFCDSTEKVSKSFRKSAKKGTIIVHALANAETKKSLIDLAKSKKIPQFDLTGGLVSFLAEQTGFTPADDLNRVHTKDGDYFERIDAWEFTMQHDDSQRLETIETADIVLVGLSRVSKTPTSAYLGWLGHRVANVSFVPASGLPKEVAKCKGKVVALTMQPRRLAEIRKRRMRVNGFESGTAVNPLLDTGYTNIRETIREVMEAEAIYKRLRLPTIDVTEATVEETAARILEITQKG